MCPRTVDTALTLLAEHGLAERVPGSAGGWRRGPAVLDDLAAQLGVLEVVEALIAEYAVERAAWRAILGLVHPLHVPDVIGHGADAGADAPPWWPDEHDPPDHGLGADAETAQLEEIVAMLRRELGAIALGTYAPEDLTDPRYGVYAGAAPGPSAEKHVRLERGLAVGSEERARRGRPTRLASSLPS